MHWNIIGVKPAYYPRLFWSMWCPRILSLCKGLVPYPAKNEEIYGIVLYQKIFRSYYITFKNKTSTCGSQVDHMWVTSGLLCGSVGQVGQQVWLTFNPDIGTHVIFKDFFHKVCVYVCVCVRVCARARVCTCVCVVFYHWHLHSWMKTLLCWCLAGMFWIRQTKFSKLFRLDLLNFSPYQIYPLWCTYVWHPLLVCLMLLYFTIKMDM